MAGEKVLTMHDQKLTEGEYYHDWRKAEFERLRDELDYFTRYYAFVRRGVEDNTKDTNLILGQRGRSNWTSKIPNLFRRSMTRTATRMVMDDVFGPQFLGGTGSQYKGDNGRWMYDPFVRRAGTMAVVGTVVDDEDNFIITVDTRPVIDHPYLLPPASGIRSILTSDGTLINVVESIWDK